MENSKKKLIVLLKKVRKEKNISYSTIVEECAVLGYYVSLSTVKRVFAEGSEETGGFRYDTTLKPIARLLLGLEDDSYEENSESEVEALRTLIELKNQIIQQQAETISKLEGHLVSKEDQIFHIRETNDNRLQEKDRKVDYLKTENASLREDVKSLKHAVKMRVIVITVLSVLLVITAAICIGCSVLHFGSGSF